MENIDPAIVGLAALVVPPVASALKRTAWPAEAKHLVALVVAVAMAAVVAAVRGDWSQLVALATQAHAVAQASYHLAWQGSQVDQWLTALGDGDA
jgi:branched-subunit amino acid transport protein